MHTITSKTKKGPHWISISQPDEQDRKLLEKYNTFSEHDIDQFMKVTKRAKIIKHEKYIYMVLMVPVYNPEVRTIDVQEVDFLITKSKVITAHYNALPPIDALLRRCEKDDDYRKVMTQSVEHMLFEIVSQIHDYTYPMIDQINQSLDAIREELFGTGTDRDLVQDIVSVRRNITDMRRALRGQDEILSHLMKRDEHEETLTVIHARSRFSALMDAANELWGSLESNKEIVEALEDANDALISHSLNDTIKTLTAVSVLLLPASVIAGLFGVNAKNMPFIGHPLDFWYIMSVMAIISIILLLVFWRKHWLR